MGQNYQKDIRELENIIDRASLSPRQNGRAGYHLGLLEDKLEHIQAIKESLETLFSFESSYARKLRKMLVALRRWHLSSPCEECGEDAIELRDPYHDTIEAVLCINPTCLHTEGLSNLLPDDE